jgi:hypothetical protein
LPPWRKENLVDTLIESLRTLIRQSTEALGPDDPSTLMLKEQLAAALAQGKSPKVFWMQPVQQPVPATNPDGR